MGRPREHDQATAEALLEAAERTLQAAGLEGLSVRGVADDVELATAPYSVAWLRTACWPPPNRVFTTLGAAIARFYHSDPDADWFKASRRVPHFAVVKSVALQDRRLASGGSRALASDAPAARRLRLPRRGGLARSPACSAITRCETPHASSTRSAKDSLPVNCAGSCRRAKNRGSGATPSRHSSPASPAR
jgi:hypothetical protein